jgi:hypothetical protein
VAAQQLSRQPSAITGADDEQLGLLLVAEGREHLVRTSEHDRRLADRVRQGWRDALQQCEALLDRARSPAPAFSRIGKEER